MEWYLVGDVRAVVFQGLTHLLDDGLVVVAIQQLNAMLHLGCL